MKEVFLRTTVRLPSTNTVGVSIPGMETFCYRSKVQDDEHFPISFGLRKT